MQSLWRSFRGVNRFTNSNIMNLRSPGVYSAIVRSELLAKDFTYEIGTTGSSFQQSAHQKKGDSLELPIEYHSLNFLMWEKNFRTRRELIPSRSRKFQSPIVENNSSIRCMTTVGHPDASLGEDSSATLPDMSQPQRIKFKRLDKTARHIMNILDKEAVEKVQADREFPDIRPGYIIQLKVEVPENKRRVSTIKGIVIARRNAGLNSTFRLRRLVAGVGVESVFPLYSPNIKEMKVLDKKKVRRAKLYYLRDRMNPLKK